MRLSTKGRYAVMAMADLAKNGADRLIDGQDDVGHDCLVRPLG